MTKNEDAVAVRKAEAAVIARETTSDPAMQALLKIVLTGQLDHGVQVWDVVKEYVNERRSS